MTLSQKTEPTSAWLYLALRLLIPPKVTGTVVDWARKHLRDPGSARSEQFNPDISPWIIKPTNCADNGTRIMTFVKPVQAGGSKCGEAAIAYWIEHAPGGDIAYYWPNGEKAKDRWEKRVERLLRATPPIKKRIEALEDADRFKISKGKILFPHITLAMLAAYNQTDVESDSYRFEVNEEIHDNHNNKGWLPGRLQQAYLRTTAYWNSVIFNISNASVVGDQLYKAFDSGTKELWEVACPGCKKRHAMRTRYEKKHPELGGLRYDSDKCKRPDGGYDYNKLEGTIRYEFPCCGFVVREDVVQRRALSLSADYSAPTNTGAHVTNRSFTLEAVSIDYIPWLTLIQEKHAALQSLRYGDPEPWKRYLQERECRFWDPEERPLTGRIVLSTDLKKDREGLANREARFFALDRQQGSLADGEVPHWWLVIRDVNKLESLLVYEGKVTTDENVIDILDRHQCIRRHGVADSGDDTTHVYQFCLRHGINAIKGTGDQFFSHPDDEGRKIFSPEKPLHQMLNAPPKNPDDPLNEPQFWLYSKTGIRERLAWLRAGGAVRWLVPGDVSENYQRHMEAVELVEERTPTGEVQQVWHHFSKRYDLFVCECYIAMLMDMAGLIGASANLETPQKPKSKKK
jgi:hypothetical protein